MVQGASADEGATIQRLRKVFTIGLLNNVLSLAINFLIPPLFISALGAERYGAWLYLFSIPTSLIMLDMGVSSAFSTDVYRLYASGDVHGAGRMFKTGCKVIASLMLVVLALASVAIGLHHQWKGDLEFHLTMWLLSLYVALGFPSELLASSFKIAGRYDYNQWLYLAGRVGEMVILLLLIQADDFTWMAAGLVMVRWSVMLAMAVLAIRLTPRLVRGAWGSSEPFKRLLLPSMMHALNPLIVFLSLQVPLLIISPAAGLTAVVTYATVRTLARLPLQLSSQISFSLYTEYTRMSANGQRNMMNRLYRRGQWMMAGLFGVYALCGLLMGEWAYELWLKHSAPAFQLIFMILLLEAFFEAFMRHRICITSSSNSHARDTVFQLSVVSAGVGAMCVVSHLSPQLHIMLATSAVITGLGLLRLFWIERQFHA